MESGGGGGGDAFASSTAPLTWHDFLERMRDPSAADFVKLIKSFIVSFTNRAPDPEKDSEVVQEFLARMEGAFRAHTLWAGSSEEDLESAGEGLEKYLMTKLFTRVFASVPEDVNSDEELFEKMSLLRQFVQPENLDIKPNFHNETSWLLAQKELQKINMFKAPRDKLVCILNCCKVINNLLINASISSKDEPPGADEFLPVLIYVTIKANPPQLHSNLLYIQRYRRQSRLVSEAAYYFTNILSAESFIWNIDAQALSMDDKEFQKKMEAARAHLSGVSTDNNSQEADTNLDVIEKRLRNSKSTSDLENSSSAKQNQVPDQTHDINNDLETKEKQPTKRPSISDLEKKGATGLLIDNDLSRHFQEFRFLYARAGDLTVDDVESLLNSYKQLAVRYVSLSEGLGITHGAHLANVETSAVQMMESEVVTAETKNDNPEEITKDISDEELMLALNESVSGNVTDDSVAPPLIERVVEGTVISPSKMTSA